jgi:hypothetical protein
MLTIGKERRLVCLLPDPAEVAFFFAGRPAAADFFADILVNGD